MALLPYQILFTLFDTNVLEKFTFKFFIFTFVCVIAKDDMRDSEIHCMKSDGPCPNARLLLEKALKENKKDDLFNPMIDIEQDVENGYESDGSVELDNMHTS